MENNKYTDLLENILIILHIFHNRIVYDVY